MGYLNFFPLSREQAHWLESLETEHYNLRQTLAFCLEGAAGAAAVQTPDATTLAHADLIRP